MHPTTHAIIVKRLLVEALDTVYKLSLLGIFWYLMS